MTPQEVKALLQQAGLPENSIMFALAQAAFECGTLTFDSVVAKLDNNLTGIVWANASYQHNCTKGSSKPQGEEPGFYAKFNTLLDWAIDFKRIVHAQFCKANGFGADWNTEGRPIESTTLEDYVHRLKLNHYFESDEATYLAGVQRYLNELQA